MRLFVAVVVVGALLIAVAVTDGAKKKKRREKFLFTIVTFKHDVCTGASSTSTVPTSGTCMARTQCTDGTADGNCAMGFGVCCVNTLNAGQGTLANWNGTYLRNANFPSSDDPSTTWTFNFPRKFDNVCQIRLDFVNFVTAAPPTSGDSTGLCSADTTGALVVTSPTAASPPVVCGTLTGQHMFFETGPVGLAGTATFSFGSATSSARTYNVKTTYYHCNSPNAAPEGCVQYFTGSTGSFQSYNFQGGVLLRSQNYQTCFRREYGFCKISFSQSSAPFAPNAFSLYGSATDTLITATETTCPQTYVRIPSTQLGGSGRICGGKFSSAGATTAAGTVACDLGPFAVGTYSSDSLTGADEGLTGYSLSFAQQPC